MLSSDTIKNLLENDMYIVEYYQSRRRAHTDLLLEFPEETQKKLIYKCTMFKYKDANIDQVISYVKEELETFPLFNTRITFFTAFTIHFININVNSSNIDSSVIDCIKTLWSHDCVKEFFENPDLVEVIRIILYRHFSNIPDSSIGLARLYFLKILF
jgi:hypothetical protein